MLEVAVEVLAFTLVFGINCLRGLLGQNSPTFVHVATFVEQLQVVLDTGQCGLESLVGVEVKVVWGCGC